MLKSDQESAKGSKAPQPTQEIATKDSKIPQPDQEIAKKPDPPTKTFKNGQELDFIIYKGRKISVLKGDLTEEDTDAIGTRILLHRFNPL